MRNTIKNNKGITIVSLVVTVIVLIILAGISINMTLGENGILIMARRAKENMERTQLEEQEKLNELYTDLEGEMSSGGEISYDVIAKLNDFKKKIADYIEEAGGIKPEYTDSTETFGERIKGIVKEVTKDATATAEDILEGKTAWVNGEKITGNYVDKNIEKMTIIKEEKGRSGGRLNENHKTITYTFTENDIKEKYKAFILFSSSSGASEISNISNYITSAPKGVIVHSMDSNGLAGSTSTIIANYTTTCIIPIESLQVGSQISVHIRGEYTWYIAGIN